MLEYLEVKCHDSPNFFKMFYVKKKKKQNIVKNLNDWVYDSPQSCEGLQIHFF